MASFLTVEDINSCLLNYNFINDFYVLDLSKLGTYDFVDEFYDFIVITKSDSNYSFNVQNSLWTGSFYLLDGNGDYVSSPSYSYDDGVLSVSGLSEDYKIVFYLSSFYTAFTVHYLTCICNSLDLDVFNGYISKTFDLTNLGSSSLTGNVTFSMGSYSGTFGISDDSFNVVKSTGDKLDTGVYTIAYGSDKFYGYLKRRLEVPKISVTGDLIAGINNSLVLNSVYDDCVVSWNDVVLPLTSLGDNKYSFNLDLSDRVNSGKVHFKVYVPKHEGNIEYTYNLSKSYSVYSPATFSDLKSCLEDSSIPLISIVGTDFIFSSSVVVGHDVVIVGDGDSSFNFNDEFNLIIDENIHFTVTNIDFTNGLNTIVQKKGTTCILNNCNFTNSKTNNNNGSIITTNIKITEIYNNNSKITTELNNCNLENNNAPFINMNGTLKINNCKFNNPNTINIDSASFINQISGNATITKTDFRIQKNNDEICTNETETGYNQCIILIGENATINEVTHNNLQKNNSLPLFDVNYNNTSYIFYKYYHTQAETCVITSPLVGYEEKSCCHAVTGKEYIFKNNAQVTRASWESENHNGFIEED